MGSDKQPESSSDLESDRHDRSRLASRIGILLILFSGVLWFSLFAIPFLPLTVVQKSAVAAADFVGVQIAWWTGAALAGPETIKRLKAWFGKRTVEKS